MPDKLQCKINKLLDETSIVIKNLIEQRQKLFKFQEKKKDKSIDTQAIKLASAKVRQKYYDDDLVVKIKDLNSSAHYVIKRAIMHAQEYGQSYISPLSMFYALLNIHDAEIDELFRVKLKIGVPELSNNILKRQKENTYITSPHLRLQYGFTPSTISILEYLAGKPESSSLDDMLDAVLCHCEYAHKYFYAALKSSIENHGRPCLDGIPKYLHVYIYNVLREIKYSPKLNEADQSWIEYLALMCGWEKVVGEESNTPAWKYLIDKVLDYRDIERKYKTLKEAKLAEDAAITSLLNMMWSACPRCHVESKSVEGTSERYLPHTDKCPFYFPEEQQK